MTLEGLVSIAGAATRTHPVLSVIAVLLLMAVVQLGLMLLVWFVIRRDSGGEDPGSGGGGGGSRRPPKPPPEGPVDWPEFERQFADYVRVAASPRSGGAASSSQSIRTSSARSSTCGPRALVK